MRKIDGFHAYFIAKSNRDYEPQVINDIYYNKYFYTINKYINKQFFIKARKCNKYIV